MTRTFTWQLALLGASLLMMLTAILVMPPLTPVEDERLLMIVDVPAPAPQPDAAPPADGSATTGTPTPGAATPGAVAPSPTPAGPPATATPAGSPATAVPSVADPDFSP